MIEHPDGIVWRIVKSGRPVGKPWLLQQGYWRPQQGWYGTTGPWKFVTLREHEHMTKAEAEKDFEQFINLSKETSS
jgi:hypothetical protein